MTDHDPDFDTVHPSGAVRFRSARGGCLHSVTLSEAAMRTDPQTLARAVLLAAEVSHLKAVMRVRQDIIDAGFTPSPDIAGPAEMNRAHAELLGHRLRPDV